MSDFSGFKIKAASLTENQQEDLGLKKAEGTYKDYDIVKLDWQHSKHATRPDSFYVQSKSGTIGWVPWVGSKVVWPWEAAWIQDLNREGVPSRMKAEKKR